MDAFEHIVAAILDREGYWTRKEVKVEITKDEKKQIGRPSSPRWEIDVVGYKAAMNEIWVVECKSYLDSKGFLRTPSPATQAPTIDSSSLTRKQLEKSSLEGWRSNSSNKGFVRRSQR